MVVILIKASIYAGFSVVICLREHSVFTAIRSFFDNFSSLVCKCPLLFLFFLGLFSFKGL